MTHEKNGIVPDDIFMSRRDQIAAMYAIAVFKADVNGLMDEHVVADIAVSATDALLDRLARE